MTTNDPDQIRSDIETTRTELGGDVDALADKVNPSKMAHRQTDKVKGAMRSARESIMGTASDAGDSAGSMARNVGDAVSGTADRAVQKAQGNPLAVGLIAFGAGWLAASLLPATDMEKQWGAAVKEKAQPLVDEATQMAKDMGEHMKQPGQEAMAAVTDRASEGVDSVKSEASGAADDVKDQAQRSAQTVTDQGSSS